MSKALREGDAVRLRENIWVSLPNMSRIPAGSVGVVVMVSWGAIHVRFFAHPTHRPVKLRAERLEKADV